MLLSNRYVFIYLEYVYMLFVGLFGSCKLKMFNTFNLLNVRGNIFFKDLFWMLSSVGHSKSYMFYFGLSRYLIASITFRLSFFSKRVFKINGIGFRLFFKDNFYFFKLGYSHLILNYLELSSFFLKKKVKFVLVESLVSPVLSIYRLLHYRKLNVYTGKGILSSSTGSFSFTKKLYKK